ncbi:MAG: winged helix-turn-helix domain-containing protein [Candidatus Nitrosotenuis sp.]
MVSKSYRDKIYMVKDIIALLVEYGELNQTALVSYCGLNLKKHKQILDNLESHGLISKSIVESGKRTVTIYKTTNKGVEFCRTIIEPYEELFPRKTASDPTYKLGILIIV